MSRFSFDATIVQRLPSKKNQPQVFVRPDDEDAFLRQCSAAGIRTRHDWHDERPMPTISARALVARCDGTDRVRCTIESTPTGRLRWLDVRPIA